MFKLLVILFITSLKKVKQWKILLLTGVLWKSIPSVQNISRKTSKKCSWQSHFLLKMTTPVEANF